MSEEPLRKTNVSLQEIDSIPLRNKLDGYQEMAYDLGQEVLKLRGSIEQKRGVWAGAKVIAQQLQQQLGRLAVLVDQGKMEHDEAKIRRSEGLHMIGVVHGIHDENFGEMKTLEGEVNGLTRSIDLIEQRFNAEVTKYERHKRMEEEDEEDDLRNVVPLSSEEPAEPDEPESDEPEEEEQEPEPEGA
jgi:hypothetical protein